MAVLKSVALVLCLLCFLICANLCISYGAPYQYKIFVASMNCENMHPPDDHVIDMLCDKLDKFKCKEKFSFEETRPDIIVVGQQEADRTLSRKFLTDKMLDLMLKELGYKLLATDSSAGVTKATGGLNYIHLGVIVHESRIKELANINIKIYKQKQLSGGLVWGKGGIACTLGFGKQVQDINGKTASEYNIGFIVVHLNAQKDEYRTSNTHNLMRALLKARGVDIKDEDLQLQPNTKLFEHMKKNFNAVFVLGDLNYRLTEDKNFDTVYKMVMAMQSKRNWLLDLDKTQGSTFALGLRFTFPKPTFYPTYKRTYSNTKYCQNFAKGSVTYEDIRSCYFKNLAGNDPIEAKRGEFKMGWLDRVGYWLDDTTVYITNEKFTDRSQIIFSDHTPVVWEGTISVGPLKQGANKVEEEYLYDKPLLMRREKRLDLFAPEQEKKKKVNRGILLA